MIRLVYRILRGESGNMVWFFVFLKVKVMRRRIIWVRLDVRRCKRN